MIDTYLRFTRNFDTEKNSYLKTPSMGEAEKLEGVCAFRFDTFDYRGRPLAEEALSQKVKKFCDNFPCYNKGVAVLFEGEYLQEGNEGVVVRPIKKIREFNTDEL
jgi:hypothetical protein